MKVNVASSNSGLESIIKHPDQIITMDANFLIPPDRSKYANYRFDFPKFKEVWLDPIFEAFPNLAIHEAVYDELVLPPLQSYIDGLINSTPQRLAVHQDEALTDEEKVLRDSIEEKIYPLTKYEPLLDNKEDRGEVKSLAYIAVKDLPYFAAHDSNAIQLVEKAEQWNTGLDNVQAIKMYELIYFLQKIDIGDKKSLRMLYKYQYHLTEYEKKHNPEWGQFVDRMDTLYSSYK
ncbi:hypothetical protein F9B85_03510 [Heliorestis acidaminivorans]|uniref:Uncharacterized protein n=1 Tax=Heliorestis acidaminivorans TaxID=553427 RepID=A0A6I0F878_9FIRM|nr:hypothetical protein [Heliorestis acidaminivorans]KAB2953698.1 hypothetical protein F9B85_03510 [Heliorestis acidaminivorans]